MDMDSQVILNALGGLEQLLSKARQALKEIGREYFVGGDDEEYGGYADPRAALAGTLQQLNDVLLIILEAAQMPDAKAELVAAWPKFKAEKDGLNDVHFDDDYGSTHSVAFEYLEHLIEALRMTVTNEITSEQAWTLTRLEAMLEDTPGLVHRRSAPPSKEKELQKIMHDYLSACFSDFIPDPEIGGSIKNFKPDCGILSVGAAIEFKLAHTKQQAIVSFTGVVEDVGGYRGSKDWTRFYAVMYQAQPFILKSQLQSDLKRIKAATWKAILVHGATNHTSKGKKTTVVPKQAKGSSAVKP
jgi:hypothetical protein